MMRNAKKEYLKFSGNLFEFKDVTIIIQKWKLKKKSEISYIGTVTEITFYPKLNETRIYTHWKSVLFTEVPSSSLTNILFIRPGLMMTKKAIEKLDQSIKFSLEKESIESNLTIWAKIIFPIAIILMILLIIPLIISNFT